MTQNPRQLAVEALIIAEQGGYSNLVLDRLLKSNPLSAANEAFFTAIFYGTIERKRTLETILGRYVKLPIQKMKPEIRSVLLMSLYQILFADKVPDSAAVNEGVQLAKIGKYRQLGGFVNAVLRAVVRDKSHLISELQTTQNLAFKFSCAPSFVRELVEQYGRTQAEAFLSSSLNSPPVYIRKNTIIEQPLSSTLNCEPTELADCYILSDAKQALRSDDFKNGLFHVEDKACQLACKMLELQPGERVLDACAAPGGKTFTMAQYLKNTGEILACDLHPNRVRLIEQGAQRLHITNIRAIENDARHYAPQMGEFDKILCDVPCSGYGVIRRKPEIKQKETEDFISLPEIQYQILQTSSRYLKKGGLLLYSTCTVRFAENDFVVHRFLKENKDYKMVTGRQLMPHTDETDGFFYCLLTR
ncbi:MAG: 16S rRNA (cytosine(967)-C(5))-methyltransferase RsmB [Clostridia bacterium]|nr:16S rRNA (cytosine(967)-C(5))-methyltransferase RsmB [Clostridia bacterium]MBQ7289075.1 16S rRNA (cytosine(967)-C(5))-methyltransferase RsmB [Clostridia bacterium]